MKKLLILILALLTAAPAMAAGPMTLAGITLGDDIGRYSNIIREETAIPMRDAAFATEVNIRPDAFPGIRGGSLTYGNCARKGAVLRVKLKFEDRDMSLFNELLDLYKKQFGAPDSWQGDAFHNIVAWEWDFGKGQEQTRLLLMYSKIEDLRPGVSIKMTAQGHWDEEQRCYTESHEYMRKHKHMTKESFDIQDYIPR